MNNSYLKVLLFFVGLFSQVRVHLIGMIGLPEILAVVSMPVLLARNLSALKREGFTTVLFLAFLMCIGAIISSLYNHTPWTNAIRGLAAPVVVFSSIIYLHHFLRKDITNFRWLVAGLALAVPLSFFLGGGVTLEEALSGNFASEQGDSNYSMSVIMTPLFTLPVILWYDKFPWQLSCCFPIVYALLRFFISESGRASAVASLAAALLIFVGRKSVKRMSSIRRYFVPFVISSLVAIFAVTAIYSYSAKSGILGEKARVKYESQTNGKSGVLSLLIGGRSEAFICVYAALDKPIMGHGPWAVDEEGYANRFRQEYGIYDYEAEANHRKTMQLFGLSERIRFISAHSHIFGAWVWYGITGLLFWTYVVYLIFKFVKRAPDAIPQWWPLLVINLPLTLWHIFFSPLGARIGMASTICAVLLAIAVSQGKLPLTASYWRERMRYSK